MAKLQEKNQFTEEMLFSYLERTASVEEQECIKAWMKENINHQKQFDELKVIYHWFRKGNNIGSFNKEESWSRIKAGYYKSGFMTALLDRRSRTRKIWHRFAIPAAAAVIFAFLAGFYIHSLLNKSSIIPSKLLCNEVYAPLGARSQIILSDGTKVWLNAGSRLRYPINFLNDSLEVTLEGEAYFDVTKMRDRIFIVKTSDIYVKVYGTQFNIKSYAEENVIQTTLIEGSLSVEPIKGIAKRNTVFLKPNQSVSYYKTDEKAESPKKSTPDTRERTPEEMVKHLVVITTVDPLPITSWKDAKWVIKGEKLDALAVKLERRYNVKITFRDESLKKYKFSGTLKEETLEQVLRIMQISAPLLFTVKDNKVTFIEDKAFRKKYDTMIDKHN